MPGAEHLNDTSDGDKAIIKNEIIAHLMPFEWDPKICHQREVISLCLVRICVILRLQKERKVRKGELSGHLQEYKGSSVVFLHCCILLEEALELI